MIDGLHPDLEARGGRVLIVAIRPARSKDEGEGNPEVSPELVTIDRYRVPLQRTTPRLPLIGAVDIRRETLPSAEEVAPLDRGGEPGADVAIGLPHEGCPEVRIPRLVRAKEDREIQRPEGIGSLHRELWMGRIA